MKEKISPIILESIKIMKTCFGGVNIEIIDDEMSRKFPSNDYPNGLLGKSWTPNPAGWPGVGNVAMNRNHLGYNTYSPVDISRQMVDVFPNPFKLIGGRKNKKLNKNNKTKKQNTKKIKGGAMSNLLGQDLINLGRQVQYGIGSAYNTVLGYPSPVNPMPWKGQFQNNFKQVI